MKRIRVSDFLSVVCAAVAFLMAPSARLAGQWTPRQRVVGRGLQCEAPAGSRCYYIDPRGNDSHSGTIDQPFFRPQTAVRIAKPGDFIYLRGGTYTSDNAYPVAAVSWDDPRQGVVKKIIDIGVVAIPAWASASGKDEVWSAPSGTASAWITIKSFPGEVAHLLNTGGVSINKIDGGPNGDSDIAYWNVENLQIEGDGIYIGAAGADSQTHDIVIRGNEVFGYADDPGKNIGLIKVDRGDQGGPDRITIENNRLHDLSDSTQPGAWNTVVDHVYHFGAICTVSCEPYAATGLDCGGNGTLTIRNNVMYNVPQVFYFKSPSKGSVLIEGNRMYNALKLGRWGSSNITFEHNLAFDIDGGFDVGNDTSQVTYPISGRNEVIRNNTFIGIPGLITFRVYGSGHTIENNVVFGIPARASTAGYGTPAYVSRTDGAAEGGWPDSGTSDPTTSQLATGNHFDHNCFVTPNADFLAVQRIYNGDPQDFDHLQAQQTFGFDINSIFIVAPIANTDRSSVFRDPANHDYHLLPNGPAAACAGLGY